MKVKMLEKNVEKCTLCHECEKTCATTFFKTDDVLRARLRVVEEKGTKKIITCTQCGVCINVCPTQALSRNSVGTVVIDKAKCVGCLSCVGFCPEEAMFYYKDDIVPFKCISCGQCAKKCPTNAIKIAEKEI